MPNYPSRATEPNTSSDWRNDFWENQDPEEYDVVDINGDTRHVVRYPYKSKWRKRKDARFENKFDLENGKQTPATEMMKKNKITGKKASYERRDKTPEKPKHEDTPHQYLVLKNGRWVMNKYTANECRTLYADAYYGPEVSKKEGKNEEKDEEKEGVKVYRDLSRGWLKNAVPGQTFEAWLDAVNYPKL